MQSNKTKVDAGWNDPPKFSYKEFLESSKSPKRSILNKRVAFPMQPNSKCSLPTTDPTATPTFNVNLPPPSSCAARITTPCELESKTKLTIVETSKLELDGKLATNAPSKSRSEIYEENDTRMLNEILGNLDAVMQTKSKSLKHNNKYELIRKKLFIMEELWEKNKLISEVKSELHKLAFELRNGNKEEADKIHVSLMVDHPKLCSEFMPALRQLINAE